MLIVEMRQICLKSFNLSNKECSYTNTRTTYPCRSIVYINNFSLIRYSISIGHTPLRELFLVSL